MGVLTNGVAKEHRYATCRDEECQRFVCRVYREGYRDGYGAGHAAGYAAGEAAGYAAGYGEGHAADAASCGDGCAAVSLHLVLAVLAILAARVGFLYLAPFGPCPKCKGTGHIQRGPRRRPVCPRRKGRKRVQRTGSRAVHRAARKIRHGRQAAARYQHQEEDS